MERVPDDLVLPPLESLREAQRLLDAALPFHAHEVLEGTWRAAPIEERDLWQGLAQLAVGLTHVLRGNPVGARTLLERGRSRIIRYVRQPPYGVDVVGLNRWATELLDRLPELGIEASVVPPRLRREVSQSETVSDA